jgi:adenosylmethionine-8-amino-7-oxononanoate aminotransferase
LRFGGVVRAPGYDDPDWSEHAVKLIAEHADHLAAVVLEPLVQGAAGMYTANPEAVKAVGRACQDAGVLLIADEVATGFGRTGALFASQLCDIRPDVLCLGKGITGGYLPMSATVASGAVAAEFEGEDLGPRTLYHGHSYSGNALAAAVALRHLHLLEEWEVLANVAARAEQLSHALEARVAPNPAVKHVRQRGLMAGVELWPGPKRGRRVCGASFERGVLLRPLGDVVVLMPILTSTEAEIERIVEVLRASIDEVCP